MNFTGLSLDQAPPISVPLRFFLLAPVFGMVAALVVLFSKGMVLAAFEPHTIVALHAITIGFFSFVMLGALTQMLPVLASATIYRVDTVAGSAHLLLFLGLFCFGFGFLNTSTLFFTLAYGFLGSGFMLLIFSILRSMRQVSNFTPTVKTMALSLVFAGVAVALGVFMLFEYASVSLQPYHAVLVHIHAVVAIFGFASLLIVGVSFQVLPMFYVAPDFKPFFQKKVVWIISFLLLLWGAVQLFLPNYAIGVKVALAVFFAAFGVAIFVKFAKRKRKRGDITVIYWISGASMLLVGLGLWVVDDFVSIELSVVSGVFLGGFVLSIMQGMLYKIIPFLVWFHLNGAGYMNISHNMINKNLAKIQFFIFVASFLLVVGSVFLPLLLPWGAALFLASMILLEYNLLAPVKLYKETKKTKPDFDMSMMQMDNR